jgi:hypothetical protein
VNCIFSWGGNRESYLKSDIHFTGADYDFKLYFVGGQNNQKYGIVIILILPE